MRGWLRKHLGIDALEQCIYRPTLSFALAVGAFGAIVSASQAYCSYHRMSLPAIVEYAMRVHAEPPADLGAYLTPALATSARQAMASESPMYPGGIVFLDHDRLVLYDVRPAELTRIGNENRQIAAALSRVCEDPVDLYTCEINGLLEIARDPIVEKRFKDTTYVYYDKVIDSLEKLISSSSKFANKGVDPRKMIGTLLISFRGEDRVPHLQSELDEFKTVGRLRPAGRYVGTWEVQSGGSSDGAAQLETEGDDHHLVFYLDERESLIRDFYDGREVASVRMPLPR